MINWLVDWLIDWLIWFINWLTHWLIDELIDCLIDVLTNALLWLQWTHCNNFRTSWATSSYRSVSRPIGCVSVPCGSTSTLETSTCSIVSGSHSSKSQIRHMPTWWRMQKAGERLAERFLFINYVIVYFIIKMACYCYSEEAVWKK